MKKIKKLEAEIARLHKETEELAQYHKVAAEFADSFAKLTSTSYQALRTAERELLNELRADDSSAAVYDAIRAAL